jgi:acyl carrier protein
MIMETPQKIEQVIFAYVKDNSYKDVSNLTSGTMLFAEGIFDSMGFVLFLDFLEEEFNIRAADSDLVEENFESIDAITDFIIKKRSSVAQ